MLPRASLVPRQPRAIKRTTRTELRDENIRSDRCVHWNNSITPTALHGRNIHNAKYIHCQTITTQMALPTNEIYLVGGLIGNNKPVDIKLENDMTQKTG